MRRLRRVLPLVLCLPLLATAGCASGLLRRQDTVALRDQSAPTVVRPQRVSDSHVAGIMLLANNVELSYARMALLRATNPDMQLFARRITNDHAGLNATLQDAVNRLDMKAKDDELSIELRETSGTRRDHLRETRTGQEFDVAYAQLEVRSHRELLELIDAVLQPSASDAELKQYVEWFKPAEQAHLAAAEQLLSMLTMSR